MSPSNRIREQRESLPTFEYKDELIEAIKEYNVLVVIGETGKLVDSHSFHLPMYSIFCYSLLGSGKTTQIPQYILESMPDIKRIGVTQPRYVYF